MIDRYDSITIIQWSHYDALGIIDIMTERIDLEKSDVKDTTNASASWRQIDGSSVYQCSVLVRQDGQGVQ